VYCTNACTTLSNDATFGHPQLYLLTEGQNIDNTDKYSTSETAILRFGTKDVAGDTPPVRFVRDLPIGGANYQFNYGGTW
jgi:hypothetical protein